MDWSFYKLNTYLSCPKVFNEIYIKKTPQPKNDNFMVGEAFHGVLEENAKTLYLTGKCLPLTDAVKLFNEKSTSHSQLITTYMRSGKALRPLGLEYIEYPFTFDCHGVRISGRIDIISDDEIVWDYKTAESPYSLVDIQDSLQLTIYAGAFYNDFKRLPKRVGYQVTLKDYSGVQQLTDNRTLDQIEAMKLLVKKCDGEVELGAFNARKGTQCSWCFIKNECRRGK